MTLYEKVIEDIHIHADEAILKEDLISALFDENIKREEVIQLFKSYYTRELIDLVLFKKCVTLFVGQKQIMDFNEVLCERASQLHSDNLRELEEYTFDLVVSSNGYERLLGRKLWDRFEMSSSELDILSFSEELQCRFALSILQDILSPKERLFKLLCLFNSPYSLVRQVLVKVLCMYTMNYCSSVKRIFEGLELMDSEELLMYKNFIKSCEQRFDLYKECIELHSEYFMPDLYEICNRETTDYMREQAEKIERLNEPSFLNFLRRVQLGRGGGWRRDDGIVTPLQLIQYSQEMPIMIASMPPLEEHEYYQQIFQDWTKIEEKHEK